MAIMVVSHDLGVIADLCDRVVCVYAGQVVEEATLESALRSPSHPYLEGLLKAMPRMGSRGTELYAIPGSVPAPGTAPSGCSLPVALRLRRRGVRRAAAAAAVAHRRERALHPPRPSSQLVRGRAARGAERAVTSEADARSTPISVLLSIDGLEVHYKSRPPSRTRCAPSTVSRSRSAVARRSG